MGEIIIKIKPDGTIEAETKEIKGKKCLDHIKPLEELLNSITLKSEFTDDYYQDEKIVLKEKNKQEQKIKKT